MGPLAVDLVQDLEGLRRLRPAWDDLLARLAGKCSPFLSHYWYLCWWRHFAAGATLQLMVVREGESVVGIVPFMKRRLVLHGVPVSCLGFLENGNSLHNDLLVIPGRREEVLHALFYFLQVADSWDVIQLNNMPLSSPNRAAVIDLLLERGLRHQFRPSFTSPYLEVDQGGWERFLAGRSAAVRKGLRRVARLLDGAGPWQVREVVDWSGFLTAWDAVRQVAQQSWTHAIGDSLATPANASFFRALAETAAAEGALSLWLLEVAVSTVAFEFHLKSAGTEYAMRASYDQRFAQLSPGTFLEMQIVKSLFERQGAIRRLDFGGSFDAYKRRWCENGVPHDCLTIFSDRPYGRITAFHEMETVRVLRELRDRLRNYRHQHVKTEEP
ncbi:MAG TPA: GNAT family N-acetyltransferase [Geomonas sp.]|nr:GNAT family N-acetyltransferase [Geomonas sp.]